MTILLDHVIVPSLDPVAGAKSLADLLGVPWEQSRGHFTPVYVNDSLTLDFARRDTFEGTSQLGQGTHHYCFHVTDGDFDAILSRLRAARIPHRGHPQGPDDMQVNTRLGGKNLYWEDADGHLWEILTVSYARADSPALSAAG